MTRELFKWLREGVASVAEADIKSPENEIEEGDVVIGEVTDLELRKFHVFRGRFLKESRQKLAEDCEQLIEQVMRLDLSKHDGDNCPHCRAMVGLELEGEIGKVVDDLFWAAIKSSLSEDGLFKLSKGGGIGLYKDWKIAVTPRAHPRVIVRAMGIPASLFEILGGLRG